MIHRNIGVNPTGQGKGLASLAWMASMAILLAMPAQAWEVSVERSPFGVLPTGEAVHQYTLKNSRGFQVRVMEYGATILEIRAKDKQGRDANVVLGSDSLQSYLQGFPAASVIGRYANRIRGAKFTLSGKEYQITKNSGENHIHGGRKNFAKVIWKGSSENKEGRATAVFSCRSPDGEEGFPGNLDVEVRYTVTENDDLQIVYSAKTDRTSILNLTNHAYFNLAGAGADVRSHELIIHADQYTNADRMLIPTGELLDVKGTSLDFLSRRAIGERIDQLKDTRGYDHNYVIRGKAGELRAAATAWDPNSGRKMECWTTEPGMQLYTANGFNGNPFPKHGGFCFETQHYPDSPNRPEFPSVVIEPGKEWRSETHFRFSLAD